MKTSFAKAATLIELVVVLLIIGILAAVSASLMQSRIHEAKWAEGKAIMGNHSGCAASTCRPERL
jgi:prepilin-type N-terminal cleavage/methylation domain-containing protein